MSNVIKVLLIILLFLIIGSLSVFLVFAINGKFDFGILGFGESTTLIEEKEFEEAKDIKVNAKTANIYIKHSTDNKYKVELYSDTEKSHSIKLDSDNNLLVNLEEKGTFFFKKSPKIVIYVPSEYENKFVIETKTADIESDSFEKAEFDVHVTTGDVNLDKVNKVSVDCTTGDIEINTVNDIYVKCTTGDIKLSNVQKHMDLNTTTGDIKIDNANITENSNIKTTTGDIKVETINNIYVEGETKTGDIKINNSDRHSEIELKIKATTGDIRVG